MKHDRREAALGLAATLGLLAGGGLTACVSVGSGEGAAPHATHELHDPASPPARLAQPLVEALLIESRPGNAQADSTAIAYSRRAHEFAYYQLASWTDSPVRRLPRLLQHRLEQRGVAAAVGMMGDPLRSDWLLTLTIDALHHDVAAEPGLARVALTADLFNRRARTRAARQHFEAQLPVARADSGAAALALSGALAATFDQLVPWLEDALRRALGARS